MRTAALGFFAPGTTRIETLDVPPLGHLEILVRMRVGGVCRGDIEVFRGDDSVPTPYFGGHEGAGIVEAVGYGVTRFAPGDNVALLGDGRFTELSVAAEHQAASLPSNITDWSEWIVEPMACCVNGVDVADVRADDVVGVIGCGFMGLGVLRVLKGSQARQLLGFDIQPERLHDAAAHGADLTFDSRLPVADTIAEVNSQVFRRPMPAAYVLPGLDNGPLDIAFETSGTAAGLTLAAGLLRVGGTLIMFGHQRGPVTIDGTQWHLKGLRVLNASPMIASDFHQIFYRTAAMMAAGKLRTAELITHKAEMSYADSILRLSGTPGYIKGVVLIGEQS